MNDLNHALTVQLGPRAIIAVQNPIRLSERSEPQPDLAVLLPRSDSYRRSHPGPADVLFLIEVSDTTVEVDKDVKLPLYARPGIRDVWLADLVAQRVEVHRDPSPNDYRSIRYAVRGDTISPLAFPDVTLRVGDILGEEEA